MPSLHRRLSQIEVCQFKGGNNIIRRCIPIEFKVEEIGRQDIFEER
jgi:hypothetical protein